MVASRRGSRASMILGFILIVYGVTEVQRENERLSADS